VPPLEQKPEMVRTAASIAAGGEIGDGVGPPVPVATGERACSDAGARRTREVTRENEKREKNEWMRPGGMSG
jgi:hypothetical protein